MNSSRGARAFAMAVAAMVGVAVLAACGGGSSTSSATTTSTTTGRGNGTAALRTCLSQHGVNMPANFNLGRAFGGRRGANGTTDTTSGVTTTVSLPPGVTEQQLRTALSACAGSFGGGNAANNPKLAAYRNCLNSYLTANGGTTLPSTGAGGFGGGFGGANGGTTTTNPLMEAAINHCAALRPTFSGRGSTTTSTTT